MAVSPLARFSDVVLGGALRLLGLACAAKAILPATEIGIRVLSTASSILTGSPENRMAARKKEDIEKSLSSDDFLTRSFAQINSLRGENMYKNSTELTIELCGFFAAAMALNELAFRVLGQPVGAFNIIGKFLGLQVLPDGIYNNLPSKQEWGNFFVRMESQFRV